MIITENIKDHVMISNLFLRHWPKLYRSLDDILTKNGVPHGTIMHTKDYWCRDYMPVQYDEGKYVQFVYNPDYLQDQTQYLTDVDKVVARMKRPIMQVKKCPLVIDGGNLVFCHSGNLNYVVITEKVMRENPTMCKEEIENHIKDALEDNIVFVWLPWDEQDFCGHTDGIARFVGENENGKPIILTNLNVYEDVIAKEMKSRLEVHFDVRELQLSDFDEQSWAYINCLQTREVIIVPGIGNSITDKEALRQIRSLYSQYGRRVYQVQMRKFIEEGGGALNCCTWTYSEKLNKNI